MAVSFRVTSKPTATLHSSSRRPVRVFQALVVALLSFALVSCETTDSDRVRMSNLVNQERHNRQLATLSLNLHLSNGADATAQRLRDSWVNAGCPDNSGDFLVHTSDLLAHYKPQLVVGQWHKVGENIGVVGVLKGDRNRAVDTVFKAYMNSPAHRDNIVFPGYRFSGYGAVYGPTAAQKKAGACPNTTQDSLQFSTQVFVK